MRLAVTCGVLFTTLLFLNKGNLCFVSRSKTSCLCCDNREYNAEEEEEEERPLLSLLSITLSFFVVCFNVLRCWIDEKGNILA